MLVFVALIVSLLLYFAITFFQVVRIDVTLHWCRWQNISCKERTCDCQVPLLYIRLNCQLVTLSFHLCGRIQRSGPRQKVSHNRMELMNVLFILFFFYQPSLGFLCSDIFIEAFSPLWFCFLPLSNALFLLHLWFNTVLSFSEASSVLFSLNDTWCNNCAYDKLHSWKII